MNDNERERIAAAISQLRPDWPLPSIRTLLKRPELAHRPRRDVAVMLAWVACESESTTPARVLENGPWRRAASVEQTTATTNQPPKAADACPIHGDHRDSCRGCASDAKAGTTTPTPDRQRIGPPPEFTAARRALHGTEETR